MSWDDERVRDHVGHLEDLLGRLGDGPGLQAVQALVDLYGEALSRVTRIAADAGVTPALTGDELLCHLLILHGLHPDSVENRVRGALDGIESFLSERRARAEFLDAVDGTVRLTVTVSGCGSTRQAVTAALEEAVRRAAPEIDRVDIRPAAPEPVLITLDTLRGPA